MLGKDLIMSTLLGGGSGGGEKTVVILPETTIARNDDGMTFIKTPFANKPQEGRTYTVSFNGTSYDCPSYAFDYDGVDTIAVGMTQALGFPGGNADAPFIAILVPNGMYFGDGLMYGIMDMMVDEATLSIVEKVKVSGGGIPQEDIDAAFAALAEKGVTIPDGATSADLDDLIASIVTGGGDEGEESQLDAMIDGSITEVSSDVVTKMRQYAFYQCESLVSANFPEVTSIPYYGFSENKALVTANFPKATKIGSSAFSYCKTLPNVNIHIAEDIGSNAFNNCNALKSVDILVKTKISAYAFAYCTVLKSVILRNTEMSTLSSWNGFDESAIERGTGYIYVPRALVDTYKAATNWSTYADRFRALEDYTVDGTITGELDPNKI